MKIQVASINFNWDAELNIESVKAFYNVEYSEESLSERGSGNITLTNEEYMNNPSPLQIAELIKEKRRAIDSEQA